MERNESLTDLSAQLDGLARLLGTTMDSLPPEMVQGLALVLGGLATQVRRVAES